MPKVSQCLANTDARRPIGSIGTDDACTAGLPVEVQPHGSLCGDARCPRSIRWPLGPGTYCLQFIGPLLRVAAATNDETGRFDHFTRPSLRRRKRGSPSISRAMRCTVPVPTPHSRATFNMPLPARKWLWICFSRAFPRFLGPLKPGADSLPDHAALEFGEGPGNLKHQPSGRCGRVNGLLVEVQIDATSLQRLDSAE
jgi:hypothetical protein